MHTPNPSDFFFNPVQYWTDVYKMQIELAEMMLAMAAVANPALARAVIRRVPGTTRDPAPAATQGARSKPETGPKAKAAEAGSGDKSDEPQEAASKPAANVGPPPVSSKPAVAAKVTGKPRTKRSAGKAATGPSKGRAPSKRVTRAGTSKTQPASKPVASRSSGRSTKRSARKVTLAPDMPPKQD